MAVVTHETLIYTSFSKKELSWIETKKGMSPSSQIQLQNHA